MKNQSTIETEARSGSCAPVTLLGVHDRKKVIEALLDEMTSSSFAEGCEERIARGLEARTDAQLLELAKSKMTWTPNDQALPHGGAERTPNANQD